MTVSEQRASEALQAIPRALNGIAESLNGISEAISRPDGVARTPAAWSWTVAPSDTRNAGRFQTVEDALRAWGDETQPWEWEGDEEDAEDYYAQLSTDQIKEFIDWLFAPAEGGAE